MTEGTGSHQGVVLYNMNDLPLGFGVTTKVEFFQIFFFKIEISFRIIRFVEFFKYVLPCCKQLE